MTYEEAFRRRLDAIQAGAWEHLEEIGTFPAETGRKLLREILETGCLAQNEENILLARKAIARLPGDWLREQLPGAVEETLFREPGWEGWEFLRLAEMLESPFPELLDWWLCRAHQLNDPEVEEAIAGFVCNDTKGPAPG